MEGQDLRQLFSGVTVCDGCGAYLSRAIRTTLPVCLVCWMLGRNGRKHADHCTQRGEWIVRSTERSQLGYCKVCDQDVDRPGPWCQLYCSERNKLCRFFGVRMKTLSEAPLELQVAVGEFWPAEEWDNAVSIAYLESAWDAFAVNDTTGPYLPCGTEIGRTPAGVLITAERSVGYFQINSCNYPDWEWQRLYNARHNAGTAHDLWSRRGWWPWYFSALSLGLVENMPF